MIVKIDGAKITSFNSFSDVFSDTFGFFKGYGRNMNAWIDCMSSLDDPDAGMTKVSVAPGQILTIHVENAEQWRKNCPLAFQAFVEDAAFVNCRRIENGENPILAVSFSVDPNEPNPNGITHSGWIRKFFASIFR